jgi:DNA-binding NarL/FixJ family response regulator
MTATRQIRQFDRSARVVMVTDYEDEERRKAAAEAGACGYALKQNLPDLPKVIGSVIGECE